MVCDPINILTQMSRIYIVHSSFTNVTMPGSIQFNVPVPITSARTVMFTRVVAAVKTTTGQDLVAVRGAVSCEGRNRQYTSYLPCFQDTNNNSNDLSD